MFDATAMESNPSELNLRLNINEVQVYLTNAPSPSPGQAKIVVGPFSFNFTVPFHGVEVVEAGQVAVLDTSRVQATRPLESGDVEMVDGVTAQPVAVT